MLVKPLVRPICRPLTSAITAALGGFNPRTLFSAGEQGAWYDLSDSTTLFADSAGITPAVVNGPVGLVLDKSGRGNHASQTTAPARPTLRGTPTGAELFAAYGSPGAGWSATGATATATTASSAIPTTTAAVVGRHYRVIYTVTRSAGSVQLSFGGRTGVSRSGAGTYEDYFDNATSTAALTATGTGFTGTVRIDEVKDVSADSVGFPYFANFDAIDDFWQTASINFTATDKMFACAGVRKISDAANGTLLMCGDTLASANGSFFIQAPGSGGATRFQYSSRGTASSAAFTTSATYNAPYSGVLAAISDIASDTNILRVNGTQVDSKTTDQGTGNYASNIIYIGRRSGASEPFNGRIYGLIIRGAATDAAKIAATENWMNRRTRDY